MKIALLTPTFYEYSGIDKVVKLDAERYAKQGDKVTIFTLDSKIKTNYAKIKVLGMPKNLALQRLYRLFFFLDLLKIRRYSKELKDFDKIRCYFYPMTWIARRARKKYKVHYQYWDAGVADSELFMKFSEKLYMKLFIYLMSYSVKNADSAVSISKFLRKQLQKQTGLKSSVEYPKIDAKRFNKKINKTKIRKKYGIKKEPVLLYIGRISPHKGVHLLIKSFEIFRKKHPSAKLIIAGRHTFKEYSNKLKLIASKNVIFAGQVSENELADYYGACDVYTTATLWEGFDLPIVEANSCGKPVVAFDIGPHIEVLKNGKLVPAKNIKKFAKAIASVLESKRSK